MTTRIRRSLILGTSYAALVDILLATMGVFVVVFAQLQIDDAPRLVQKPVDGIAICAQEDSFTVYDAQTGVEQATSSSFANLSQTIQRLWPNGASVMVGMLLSCATSPNGNNIWRLETDIRSLEQMSRSYLIEVVPLNNEGDALGSTQRFLDRWRQTVLPTQVTQ